MLQSFVPRNVSMNCSCSLRAFLLFLVLGQNLFGSVWHADARPLISKPDYSLYHKKDDLLEEVKTVVRDNPKIMKFEEQSRSEDGYPAPLAVVTVDRGGLTSKQTTKRRMLLSFGEHGRELITTEVGLRFLQTLADRDRVVSLMGTQARGEKMLKYLDNIIFKIFPMENANGRALVESGRLCERRNGRGVDPNRNWDIDFGKKEDDYDPNEEYPGKYAFSEPEVQMILEIAKDFRPEVWVNVHSGMEAIFMPYDHVGSIPEGDAAQQQLQMMKQMNADVCERKCAVGSGGHTVGYLAHGTATDYMYAKLHVPLAFTWEIFGDDKAAYQDCFKMFNPVTKETFEKVVVQWTKMIFRTIELIEANDKASEVIPHSNANSTTSNSTDRVLEPYSEENVTFQAMVAPDNLFSGSLPVASVVIFVAVFVTGRILWRQRRRALERLPR